MSSDDRYIVFKKDEFLNFRAHLHPDGPPCPKDHDVIVVAPVEERSDRDITPDILMAIELAAIELSAMNSGTLNHAEAVVAMKRAVEILEHIPEVLIVQLVQSKGDGMGGVMVAVEPHSAPAKSWLDRNSERLHNALHYGAELIRAREAARQQSQN